MADVFYTNFALQSANHAFSAIWKGTRAIKKAGWTYKASSDGSTKDTTGTASNDKWGGSADPSSDTYPTGLDSVAAWWCAQGPTTLKVSMTAATTGTFLRGEKVTQATSLAEGELVGLDFDGVSTGHAVIIPRTGTFDNSHVITGALSGATFTSTGIETYVAEIVFFKSSANTTQGSIYMQRVSNENENSSRFSVLTGAAGCTATVAPGGGGTGNSFPTLGSYVACGTQTGTPAHSNWFQVATNLGKAQLIATNNTGSTGVTPDGTFWMMIGDTASATQAELFGYVRCDDSEDGDLDPFVFFKLTSIASNNANARLDGSGTGSLGNTSTLITGASSSMTWKGWRRRGFSSADAFQAFGAGSIWMGSGATTQIIGNDNLANPDTIACSYSTKRVRERIILSSNDNTKKMRKGSPRWYWLVQGNTTFDTFDSKTKIVVIPSSTSPGHVIGPYDGTTTPAQS